MLLSTKNLRVFVRSVCFSESIVYSGADLAAVGVPQNLSGAAPVGRGCYSISIRRTEQHVCLMLQMT